MSEPEANAAYLVGQQAKLLKALCRVVLVYIRWRMSPSGDYYKPLIEALHTLESVLDGKQCQENREGK